MCTCPHTLNNTPNESQLRTQACRDGLPGPFPPRRPGSTLHCRRAQARPLPTGPGLSSHCDRALLSPSSDGSITVTSFQPSGSVKSRYTGIDTSGLTQPQILSSFPGPGPPGVVSHDPSRPARCHVSCTPDSASLPPSSLSTSSGSTRLSALQTDDL